MLFSLREIMHQLSSLLLVPTIAVLVFFLLFALVELGSIAVEWFFVQRLCRFDLSRLVSRLKESQSWEEMERVIVGDRVSRRQREWLVSLLAQAEQPYAVWEALARRVLTIAELFYEKRVARTEVVARLGPMLGLMATLIPLGPGLVALSQGDTRKLAESLLTAFDATVLGLASAALAYFISRVRRQWYEDALSFLETIVGALLEVKRSRDITAKEEAAHATGRS